MDPFLDGLWVAPPAYDAPYGIMELSLASGGYSAVNQIKDPGTNLATAVAGDRIGVGVSSADGLVGERLELELAKTDAELREFPEKARRAGAFPGWFRDVPPAQPEPSPVRKQNGIVREQANDDDAGRTSRSDQRAKSRERRRLR